MPIERWQPGWLEELKERHPYPGGWRASALATSLECAAAGHVRELKKPEGWLPWFMAENAFDVREGFPEIVSRHGRVFARCGWLGRHIVKPGWDSDALRCFIINHATPSIRFSNTRRESFQYFDVEVFARQIVTSKTHTRHRILPYVAEWLQGSGSINDKLLAFLSDGAE